MPLELRKNSKWWYGRFKVNGERHCVSLGIEVKGTLPPSLRFEGSKEFERSRLRAQAKLERLIEQAKSAATSARQLKRLYEIRTGESVGTVLLKDLYCAWANTPTKRQRSKRYMELATSMIGNFQAFIEREYPKARKAADIKPKMARAFLEAEAEKGIAGRTWNSKLILLRSVFNRLGTEAGMMLNPFEGIPTKDEDTVHRAPFTEAELEAILQASDDFTRPIIVTALCTAMRQGDCCLLEQAAVDLKSGFVTVKTSKTGETAEIPIFPFLHAELVNRIDGTNKHAFPEQAEMYSTHRQVLSKRIGRVLTAAGIVRQGARSNGIQKASVRDFHSFRTTWITMALSSGVPMELVRRVTGHATVDVVIKHYVRPGREDFRNALQSHMPALLVGEKVTSEHFSAEGEVLDRVRELLTRQTADNWQQVRDEALAKMMETSQSLRPFACD